MKKGTAGQIQDGGMEKEYQKRGHESGPGASYFKEGVSKIKMRENQQNHWRFLVPMPAEGQVLTSWAYKIEVHFGIGICPLRTLGLPCPVCEWRDTAWDTHDKEFVKTLYPQPRMLANALDRMDPQKQNEVQIADMPKIMFYDEVLQQCRIPETGQVINVADVANGYDIYFTYNKPANSPGKYGGFLRATSPNNCQAIVDAAGGVYALSDVVVIKTYEELKEAFKPEFLMTRQSASPAAPPVAPVGSPAPVATAPGVEVEKLGQNLAAMQEGATAPVAAPAPVAPVPVAAPTTAAPPAAEAVPAPVAQPVAAPVAVAPQKIAAPENKEGPFG